MASKCSYHFCILYDMEDEARRVELQNLAEKIQKTLETSKFRGYVPHQHDKPDWQRTPEACKMAYECQYIIPIITVRSDAWIQTLVSQIELARQIKLRQGKDERVLPVFYKVSEYERKNLLDDEGLLATLSIVDCLDIDDDDDDEVWLIKLKKVVVDYWTSKQAR